MQIINHNYNMDRRWSGERRMILLNEHDLSLYERMATELRQVAADLRSRPNEFAHTSVSAKRLEAYATAIDTNLRVEVA